MENNEKYLVANSGDVLLVQFDDEKWDLETATIWHESFKNTVSEKIDILTYPKSIELKVLKQNNNK